MISFDIKIYLFETKMGPHNHFLTGSFSLLLFEFFGVFSTDDHVVFIPKYGIMWQ